MRKEIPRGPYCYEHLEDGSIKACPHWGITRFRPYQNNGYCKLLKRGDWNGPGLGFLWDSIKECGINDDE